MKRRRDINDEGSNSRRQGISQPHNPFEQKLEVTAQDETNAPSQEYGPVSLPAVVATPIAPLSAAAATELRPATIQGESELECKRRSSRMSSMRHQARKKIEIEHLIEIQNKLQEMNSRLREENKILRNFVEQLRERAPTLQTTSPVQTGNASYFDQQPFSNDLLSLFQHLNDTPQVSSQNQGQMSSTLRPSLPPALPSQQTLPQLTPSQRALQSQLLLQAQTEMPRHQQQDQYRLNPISLTTNALNTGATSAQPYGAQSSESQRMQASLNVLNNYSFWQEQGAFGLQMPPNPFLASQQVTGTHPNVPTLAAATQPPEASRSTADDSSVTDAEGINPRHQDQSWIDRHERIKWEMPTRCLTSSISWSLRTIKVLHCSKLVSMACFRLSTHTNRICLFQLRISSALIVICPLGWPYSSLLQFIRRPHETIERVEYTVNTIKGDSSSFWNVQAKIAFCQQLRECVMKAPILAFCLHWIFFQHHFNCGSLRKDIFKKRTITPNSWFTNSNIDWSTFGIFDRMNPTRAKPPNKIYVIRHPSIIPLQSHPTTFFPSHLLLSPHHFVTTSSSCCRGQHRGIHSSALWKGSRNKAKQWRLWNHVVVDWSMPPSWRYQDPPKVRISTSVYYTSSNLYDMFSSLCISCGPLFVHS